MATLMGCGLKVGHARRLHSKLQAQSLAPSPTPQPPAAASIDGCPPRCMRQLHGRGLRLVYLSG